ncbi:unnamed protein product [marine sediment metagenome]|uniref:Uncharacterized protein n=1 Tax=marine sediment metagenome TaxID=412755 RepID=X1U1S0_9ZZZZ
MALSPEIIRRRKRREQQRAPLRPLRKKLEGLSADERLEELLNQLLEEAKLDTLFTMTLERDRLFSALYYAGFVAPAWINTEIQLLPLAPPVTIFTAIPPGTVLVPKVQTAYNSIPWYLAFSLWIDSGPPAAPSFAMLRVPGYYSFVFGGIVPIRHFIQVTLMNTHVANTMNVASIYEVAVMTEAVWKMLETIYLKPIAEHAQETAEELTGRPFP